MPDQNAHHFQADILDSLTEGVFTVDLNWRITSFNQAAEIITGVSREEALAQPCSSVFRSSICENSCAMGHTLDTGEPVVNQTIYILDSQGRRIPISISTALLKDREGNIAGGVETFRDISQIEELRKQLRSHYTFADIIGKSRPMQQLFELLPLVADNESTILLQGATGTGKELVARAIHNLSPRQDKPFVAINCGAIPDTLLESELFGYKAGAFTDARRDKPGKFQLAEGGTIFLDEIGEVSSAMQVRLLRVLQERQVEPLGGTSPVSINVRILAATNRDLADLVSSGEFREDLFYRINVMQLDLPPLKDRREDIPYLIEHFVDRFNCRQGKDVMGLSEEAIAMLMSYDFPGNVRELENIIEHAFVLCRQGLIKPLHLPPRFLAAKKDVSLSFSGRSMKEIEKLVIEDSIRRHQGNKTAAARELEINPSTLFRKMKSLAIEVETIPEIDS